MKIFSLQLTVCAVHLCARLYIFWVNYFQRFNSIGMPKGRFITDFLKLMCQDFFSVLIITMWAKLIGKDFNHHGKCNKKNLSSINLF